MIDTSELQPRLSQLHHLLPSQREWLERLLFQLAFNDVTRIDILGQDGSGKSTMALALAELFSEQYNVALLNARIEPEHAASQLMQQWFSQPLIDSMTLAEQVAAATELAPLLLIIDDAERYPATLLQQLMTLPCILCCFSAQPVDGAGLTLTLNRITPDDVEQLLQHESLNSIELAARLTQANGNLHLLLLPPRQSTVSAGVLPKKAGLPLYLAASAVTVTLLAALGYSFWPDSAPVEPGVRHPVSLPTPQAQTETVTDIAIAQTQDTTPDDASVPQQTDIVADAGAGQTPAVDNETVDVSDVEEPAIVDDVEAVVPADKVGAPTDDAAAQAGVESSTPAETTEPAAANYTLDEARLLQMSKSALAVQLAVLSSDAALQRFLRTYPDVAVVSYQRNWQGKMQLVLLLAPFDSKSAAQAAMAQLPAALRSTGPFVKGIQAVQAEIKARQSSLQDSTD